MRQIDQSEKVLNVTDIVSLFNEQRMTELHATNVGQAAKKLGLDYVEFDILEATQSNGIHSKKQKFYAEQGIPSIFVLLDALVAQRARYAH